MRIFMKSITDEEEEAREEDASIHLQISMFINLSTTYFELLVLKKNAKNLNSLNRNHFTTRKNSTKICKATVRTNKNTFETLNSIEF